MGVLAPGSAQLETDAVSTDVDVKVNIYLKRQIYQHILGIYLPSLFIMAITMVSFSPVKYHNLKNSFRQPFTSRRNIQN